MATPGVTPKDNKVGRTPRVHEWIEVPRLPFRDAPKLPRLPGNKAWPKWTREWWKAVSTMPHCALWASSDWAFAFDTARIAAAVHDGDAKMAGELRLREKQLGTTLDSRLALRIRYVDPPQPEQPANVTSLDDYRDL